MNRNSCRNRLKIGGFLTFETAFHIGSGKEGVMSSSNMGVLTEPDGRPVLPGSTLKGSFRAFSERLSEYLGLSACLLDNALSGETCYTGIADAQERKTEYEQFKKLKTEDKKMDWLTKKTCDICRLFGSPLQASRIFFSDGMLTAWDDRLQIRDGVCIDRDSGTARHGAKYDFEVVPAGAQFGITIELENAEENELALVGAVLNEWQDGFRLGGFVSRGLGRVRLEDLHVRQVDFSDSDQLESYLIKREMQPVDELLLKSLENILGKQGGDDAEKND